MTIKKNVYGHSSVFSEILCFSLASMFRKIKWYQKKLDHDNNESKVPAK